jgi:hypothetical protein
MERQITDFTDKIQDFTDQEKDFTPALLKPFGRGLEFITDYTDFADFQVFPFALRTSHSALRTVFILD